MKKIFVLKKLVIVILIMSTIVQLFPQHVVAQEIQEFANEETIGSVETPSPTPFESEPDPTPQSTIAMPEPTAIEIKQDENRPFEVENMNISEEQSDQQSVIEKLTKAQTSQQSASFRKGALIKRLIKSNFRSDEKITITAENISAKNLEIKLFNHDGKEVDVAFEEISDTDPAVIRVFPKNRFKPGRYRVVVEDQVSNVKMTQNFTWGVLSINSNKSIYLPNEEAKIHFAVLDELGAMVCDAKLELRIKNQELGIDDILSTEDQSIHVNPECLLKAFTTKPDYEAIYKVGEVGVYSLELLAETPNGTYSISDAFEVRQNVLFDVERSGPTRIYPPKEYPVNFTIKANEDFTGTIIETVPDSFDVIGPSEGIPFSKVTQVLGANTSQINPQISKIGLPFKGDHPVSQDFGGIETDPILKERYTKFGVLGHDGVDFSMPVGTEVVAVDDGMVARTEQDGDYGTTIVIKHQWGKSYYGHLSEFKSEVGDIVKKGEVIALSGNSGLSTGAHLHFGIKTAIHDMNNGFFGKVNPLPYFTDELQYQFGSGTSQVLGEMSIEKGKTDDPVKKIIWDISIKKGETVRLGYKFKAPNVSPEFYLLGPLEFNQENLVFREARLWQIAADAVDTYSTAGTFQWEAPVGATSVTVEAWGGGGGGKGGTLGLPGAGGGGGAYTKKVVSVTPGNTYDVVVGAGGAAGTANGGNGGNGEASSFSGDTTNTTASGGTGATGTTGATAGSANGGTVDESYAGGAGGDGHQSSVTQVGAASSATTSVSIPTHIKGDLIVIMAFRDGSTTAPTVPTGWTVLGTSGANVNSSVMAFKIAASASETSGTWTNATELAVNVFRGHGGIGIVGGSDGSSATMSYPAVTLTDTDGSSWVAGFGAHRSATNVEQAPTGMTNRTSAGTEIAAHDTGAGSTSWSVQTVGVNANSGWRTWVVEIKSIDTTSAISLVGAGSAATTSVSIPAHQVGDLITIFAYRDGSNTAPTVPTGWNIWGAAAGGNTNSSVGGYIIADTTTETSGTWTNATELVVHVYRGHGGIGGSGAGGANSNSISYPALTMSQADGSSWVAGFAGHRSATNVEQAPTGMTNRTSVGTEAAGHDTNGLATSWSATTVTVDASSGWRARTLEIKAAVVGFGAGGGGSSAGDALAGVAGSANSGVTGGAGGTAPSGGGNGGAGGNAAGGSGTSGSSPGGAGGGGANLSSSTNAGGAGNAGKVILTYTVGPTLDQLLRHGKWFSGGVEQPFTF